MAPTLPPEILNEIFETLSCAHVDARTLYNCMRVNRLWCRSGASTLWARPFYTGSDVNNVKEDNNAKVIGTILSCLTSEDRTRLTEQGFCLDLLPPRTSFAYAAFVRHIDFENMVNFAYDWCEVTNQTVVFPETGGTTHEIHELLRTLVRVFMRHNAKLQVLSVSRHCEITDDQDFVLLSEAEFRPFFSTVREVRLAADFCQNRILAWLAGYCERIEDFKVSISHHQILFFEFGQTENIPLLIRAQRNLRTFHISALGCSSNVRQDIIDSLEVHTKTLQRVTFDRIDFRCCRSFARLGRCENLETIDFLDCRYFSKNLIGTLVQGEWPRLKRVKVHGEGIDDVEKWAAGVNGERTPARRDSSQTNRLEKASEIVVG